MTVTPPVFLESMSLMEVALSSENLMRETFLWVLFFQWVVMRENWAILEPTHSVPESIPTILNTLRSSA